MMRSAHSTRPTKIATAEFCASLSCICFRDPTGPAAGPSSKDRNVFSENLCEGFAERRPAYGHHGAGSGLRINEVASPRRRI